MTALDLRHVRAIEEENRRLKDRVEELKFSLKMLSQIGGAQREEADIDGLDIDEMTPTQRRIISALHKRSPHPVQYDVMWGLLYGDKPSRQQPESKVISAFICQMRPLLARTRWRILTVSGFGYALHRLTP